MVMQWNKCSDKQAPAGVSLFVIRKVKTMCVSSVGYHPGKLITEFTVAYLRDNEWFIVHNNKNINDVTHWMLPELPENEHAVD